MWFVESSNTSEEDLVVIVVEHDITSNKGDTTKVHFYWHAILQRNYHACHQLNVPSNYHHPVLSFVLHTINFLKVSKLSIYSIEAKNTH